MDWLKKIDSVVTREWSMITTTATFLILVSSSIKIITIIIAHALSVMKLSTS